MSYHAQSPWLAAVLLAMILPIFAQAQHQPKPQDVYVVCYYEESTNGAVHNSGVFPIGTEHFDAVQASWLSHGSSRYGNEDGEINGCVGRHTQVATEQALQAVRSAGIRGTTDGSWQPPGEFLAPTEAGDDRIVEDEQTKLFGALAIDSNQGSYFGWAVDLPTQSDADRHAANQCAIRGGTCSIVMRFSNACAAYVADQQTGSTVYGWAQHDKHRATAERLAQTECVKRGGIRSRCITRVWGCTTRGEAKVARNDALPLVDVERQPFETAHAEPQVLSEGVAPTPVVTKQAEDPTTRSNPTEELIGAALSGDVAAMRNAIRQGADVDARKDDVEGATALMWAAFKGDQAMVSALLEAGANVNATDNQGDTAVDEAQAMGHDHIVAILTGNGRSDGATGGRPLGAIAPERQPRLTNASMAQAPRWGFCMSKNIIWKKARRATFGRAKRYDEFYTQIFAVNDAVDLHTVEGIWNRYCESELTWKEKSKRRSYTQDCRCYWKGTRAAVDLERSKRIEFASSIMTASISTGPRNHSVDWTPPSELIVSTQDGGDEEHAWLVRKLPTWIAGSSSSSSSPRSGGASDAWGVLGALAGTAVLADRGILDVKDAATIANTIASASTTSPSAGGSTSDSSELLGTVGVLAGTAVLAERGDLDLGTAQKVIGAIAAGGDADDAIGTLNDAVASGTTEANANADWDGISRGAFCWGLYYYRDSNTTGSANASRHIITNVFVPHPDQTCPDVDSPTVTAGSHMVQSWDDYAERRFAGMMGGSYEGFQGGCEPARTLEDAEEGKREYIRQRQPTTIATIAVPRAVTSTWRPWLNGLYGEGCWEANSAKVRARGR